MIDFKKPIKLDRASAWRTYTGGSLIGKLHGDSDAKDTNFPEEWIMSTVSARNEGRENIVEGLSMIHNTNISLADAICAHGTEMLGERHLKKFGKTPGVLVKLIDSAERLTVQVHPTRKKAKELFNSDYGKTECWHILGGRELNGEKPCIYIGFKKGITRDYWKQVFDKQDIEAMLNCLHKIEVKAGDTFLIEGGVPHAIGNGCFLVEIQEPTDYTIRTERTTPNGLKVADFMCHQGLGFDKMFDCFEYEGFSEEEILERWKLKKNGETLVGYDDTKMFSLKMIDVSGKYKMSSGGTFSGIYVLSGNGKIDGGDAAAGAQYFIPASCSDFEIEGNLKIIRFYGPKEDE